MKPRNEEKQAQKAPQVRGGESKPKLQIVKLEERIAPKLAANHNETLVREPAPARPKAAKVRTEPKPKLQIVKLEKRITPGINLGNHNETLVRDRT
jgi:hypothetical protein